MPDLASFLLRLAAGEFPPVPAALPPELAEFLKQLLQALRDASNDA